MFIAQPTAQESLNARVSGSILRPRRQLIAGGIAYVTPRATTLAAVMALKALDEPSRMQPKTTTQAVVHTSAYTGTSRVGWTFAMMRLRGRPRSRAKA